MNREQLDQLKNIPVQSWRPVKQLSQELLAALDDEYLIDRRNHKLVPTWSTEHKGFVDMKLKVDEFRLRHHILEVYDGKYICTQNGFRSVYAFACGKCVDAGDQEAILVEMPISHLSKVQLVIERVKERLAEFKQTRKTRKIKMY